MGANRASVVQHMLRGEVPAAAAAAAQAAKGKEKKAEGDSATHTLGLRIGDVPAACP